MFRRRFRVRLPAGSANEHLFTEHPFAEHLFAERKATYAHGMRHKNGSWRFGGEVHRHCASIIVAVRESKLGATPMGDVVEIFSAVEQGTAPRRSLLATFRGGAAAGRRQHGVR
jgi:hypothetical protein